MKGYGPETEPGRMYLAKCARCGGEHKDLILYKLGCKRQEFSHWAICPYTTEPILVVIAKKTKGKKHAKK
jgi:hypothetical protein